MKLECIVPPAQEPVTVAEANEFLRIDDDIEDSLVESFIVAARMLCENYQHQAYYTQTLRLTTTLDEGWGVVELPRSQHLQKINKAIIKLADGNTSKFKYHTSTGDIWTRIIPVETLPVDAEIIIEYVVGEDNPQIDDVKTAIKLLVSGMHNNRTPYSEGNKPLQEVPFSVKALLNRGRVLL